MLFHNSDVDPQCSQQQNYLLGLHDQCMVQDPVLDATVRELKKAFPKVQLRKVITLHTSPAPFCKRATPQPCYMDALIRRMLLRLQM